MTRTHTLAAACAAICAGYFFVGLWPFNFFPRNRVSWLQSGIAFERRSVAYGDRPLDLPQHRSGGLTIELVLETPPVAPARFGAILALYGGELPENLVIGQSGSQLILRTALRNARGARRFHEVPVEGLRGGARQFVTIASGPSGTAIYLDGALVRKLPRLTPAAEMLRGRVILGNAAGGQQDWQGKLFGASVFARALHAGEVARHHTVWRADASQGLRADPDLAALYLFDEGSGRTVRDHSPFENSLRIPYFYRAVRKSVLHPFWKDRPLTLDLVVNFVGFVPFGFIYFVYRQRTMPARTIRNVFLALLVAAIISLLIELLQVYLPTRSSSLTDLVCNAAGAGVGAVLAQLHGVVLNRRSSAARERLV